MDNNLSQCLSSKSGTFVVQDGQIVPEDSNLLIQVASAGYEDPNSSNKRYQIIQSNGSKILNEITEKAIRATKLRFVDGSWTLVKTDNYDTAQNGNERIRLKEFLNTFVNEELLIMTTQGDPSKNYDEKDILINNFGATQTSDWAPMSSYVLISKKDDVLNQGKIFEKQFQGVIEETTTLKCSKDEIDWVATCQNNRTSFITPANLPNCLVTADFAGTKECFKCESGQTYDHDYQCITLAAAEQQGLCQSLSATPVGTDECSQCDQGKQTCADGQVLAADNMCVAVIPNCDSQDCNGVCLECVNGYFLATDANVCVTRIEQCADLSSDGQCLNCTPGYVEVTDNLCCPEIKNCKVYGEKCGECKQICEEGHFENSDKVCVAQIEHCANQRDDGLCSQCDNGYILQHNHIQCDEYVEPSSSSNNINCKTKDDRTGQCIECYDNQALAQDDDVCVPWIYNCEVYKSSGECIECKNNQLLADDDLCCEKIKTCKEYNENCGCASQCEEGQVQSNKGDCIPEIDHCVNQEDDGDCKECEDGQNLAQDDKKVCVKTIDNCKEYKSSGECMQCKDTQILADDDLCCQEIKNCKKQSATCGCDSQCEEGQVENNKGDCIPEIDHCVNQEDDGDCKECEDTWNLAQDDKKVCVISINNCETQLSTGKCEMCMENQILVSDNSGNDFCVLEITNCKTQDTTTEGTCLICEVNQELSHQNSLCVGKIDNCEEQSSSGSCNSCLIGYLGLQDNFCSPIIQHCEQQDYDGTCELCEDGYAIAEGGKCTPKILYCSKYGNNGQCVECVQKYKLDGLKCLNSENCKSYNYDDKCVQCVVGYKLSKEGQCEINL